MGVKAREGDAASGDLERKPRVLFLQVLEGDSQREAERLLAQLRRGTPFDELAKLYSPERLRERSGYLGTVREDELDPAMREGVSERREGEICGPIEMNGRFLIVRLLRAKEAAALQAPVGSAEFYLQLGLLLGEKSEWAGEIEAYEKAIDLAPDFKEAYVNLGEALRRKALRVLDRRERVGDSRGGSAEEVLRIVDDAIDQFKVALALDPAFAEARYDLGLAYVAAGLLDLALLEFKEAMRLRPADGEIRKSIAGTYFLKGDYELAREHAVEARKLGADVGWLMRRIGGRLADRPRDRTQSGGRESR
jgi:tetratricopeptide (TPR) repeat protein